MSISRSIFPNRIFFIIALCAASVLANGASATPYNLNTSWSNTNNPNSPWTLRGDSTVLPFQTNIPNLGLPGQGAWAPGSVQGNFLPAWFKAVSAVEDWLVGDVVVHTPDAANGGTFTDANVLFTAPVSGLADISGELWNARNTADRPQGWRLYINGVLQTSGALAGVARSASTDFSIIDVFLNAGDTVMLSIFRTNVGPTATSTGDFVGANLIVDLAPSAVPAPAALPLFASVIGLAGWFGWRRKRKSKQAVFDPA